MIKLENLSVDDSFTRYEEVGTQKKDLNLNNSVSVWKVVLFVVTTWLLFLCAAAAVQCYRESDIVGPVCAINSEATKWGSTVYCSAILGLLSLGLYYKNGRGSKVQLFVAITIVCAIIPLDIFVVDQFASTITGLLTVWMLCVWMFILVVDVCRNVHYKILTRGTRKKMPRVLTILFIVYTLNCIAMGVLKVRYRLLLGEFVVWILFAVILAVYVLLLTIHIKKVKFMVYNATAIA